jgi:hypothetical protein
LGAAAELSVKRVSKSWGGFDAVARKTPYLSDGFRKKEKICLSPVTPCTSPFACHSGHQQGHQ